MRQAEKVQQPNFARENDPGGYAYPFIDKEILEQSFHCVKRTLYFSMVLHLKESGFAFYKTIFG